MSQYFYWVARNIDWIVGSVIIFILVLLVVSGCATQQKPDYIRSYEVSGMNCYEVHQENKIWLYGDCPDEWEVFADD